MANAIQGQYSRALEDILESVRLWRMWYVLGNSEIRQRYRRSTLGPFWLTVSTGVLVGGMGPLYGRLFGLDISSYFPFVAISFVVWLFMANIINDACTAFISAEGYIKHFKIPLTTHILRMVWKNLIIFGHNVVIIFLVLFAWPPEICWQLLTALLGVMLIAVNGVWIGLLLGLLCARFRDISQIVSSLVQVAFFLTPVMWQSGMLGRNQWAAQWNPFFHFLEVVRSPLTVGMVQGDSWAAVLGVTAIGFAVTFAIFARFRARIAYWV